MSFSTRDKIWKSLCSPTRPTRHIRFSSGHKLRIAPIILPKSGYREHDLNMIITAPLHVVIVVTSFWDLIVSLDHPDHLDAIQNSGD